MILDTGRTLDTAAHIHPVGTNLGDGDLDVLGRQPTGEDYWPIRLRPRRQLPGERCPRTARQRSFDVGIQEISEHLVVWYLGQALRILDTNGLDHWSGDLTTKLRRLTPMQLNAVEPTACHRLIDSVKPDIYEQAHRRHKGGQRSNDLLRLLGRDVARARWIEHEPQSICPGFDSRVRILKTRDAADLHMDHTGTRVISPQDRGPASAIPR